MMLTGLVISLGFILIVGGIVVHKGGAVVVGLIISAVATQQLIAARKTPK
jgi:hypothetical protein